MGGCDPVQGLGEGHIVQLGAPSNSQPKPIAGLLLADDRTWCRLSRNPQRAAANSSPATGRSRLPDGGPHIAEDGVVGASEPPRAQQQCNRSEPPAGRRPVEFRRWCSRSQRASFPARRRNSTGRSRQPDSGPQSAADGAVGASEPPALHPSNRPEPAAGRRPAECRRWCSRSRPRAAALQPAGAGCWTAARRVQKMVVSEPTSPPRAAVLQPAGAGCRTAARRVQQMM
jgi:hypothetical protein